MKVVLFCGGQGTRLREYSESIPKPMVPIGYRPILWHVMKYYASYGHKDFILCLGYKADVIKNYFLHYEESLSNDFVLSDLAWNSFRSHAILEYEIPKYDGDLGAPNLLVPLSDELARRKAAHLCAAFASQHHKQWFDEETFLGLMRLRGIEAGGATRYAEGFYGRKLVV